jgi:hypothetical protein
MFNRVPARQLHTPPHGEAEQEKFNGDPCQIGFGVGLLLRRRYVGPAQQSPKTMKFTGRVTAVASDSITVTRDTSLTFVVDESTKVVGEGVGSKTRAMKADGKSPTIMDLVEKRDSVNVKYEELGDGKLRAAEVKISVKFTPKQ